MKTKTKLLLILLLCPLWFVLLPGRIAVAVPQTSVTQNPIRVRYPDAARLKVLQADRRFHYGRQVQPNLTFWGRFWQRFGRWLDRALSGKASSNVFRYALYILSGAMLIWIILRLLQVDFTGIFGRRGQTVDLPYETYTENIHEIDFPLLLAQAEARGDYRRAIRLYYLQILKGLTDRNLIQWSPGKTNRSYVREIGKDQLRGPFEAVTREFEFVWYGAADLQAPGFQKLRGHFDDLYHMVKARG